MWNEIKYRVGNGIVISTGILFGWYVLLPVALHFGVVTHIIVTK